MKLHTPPSRPLNRSQQCWLALAVITASYVIFWLLLLGASAAYATPDSWLRVLASPEIRHATWLSLISCTAAADTGPAEPAASPTGRPGLLHLTDGA